MKMDWDNAGKGTRIALLTLVIAGLIACSSPAEQANKYYEKGLALMEQGDLVKARIELQNALQIRPELTDAWFALAQIAEQQGDWEKLFGLLNKVVDQNPQHLDAQIKLGRMLLAAGRLDKALSASNVTVALAPENAEVLGLRAGVLYKQGDIAGAVAQANAALKLSPGNIDALVVLATERLTANDPEKAIEYLDRGLRTNEKNIALQLIKVQALETLAQTDSSEAIFRKLIALYPDNRALRHALAQFYVNHGRADAAEAEYRTIAAENPADIQARLDVVRFIGSIKGKEAAQQHLQEMIRIEPNNNELNFALATMLQAEGEQPEAEAIFRRIIQRSGDSPDAIKAKGLLASNLLAEGNRPEAQDLINQVLAGDKRNEQGLLLKASIAVDERKFDSAIADLRTILRDSPNSPRALLMLAKTHELAGAPELAQENYQKAYEAGKPAPQFGIAYSEFLLKRGQSTQAEVVASSVLQAEPGSIPALRVLAQSLLNQGDWAGAQLVADDISKVKGQEQLAEEIRGAAYVASKDLEASIAAFRRAYAAAPSKAQPMVSLVRTYLLAGRTDDAMDFLGAEITADPANVPALLLLGELQAANGDTPAASQTFERAISQQPKNTAGYTNLANLQMREGNTAAAEQVIKQGLLAAPGDFDLLMAQASIYEVSARFEEAIAAYEALLKSYPGSDTAINNLASLLSEHRADQASLQRAYEMTQRFSRSDSPYFKDTLGWASYRLGKFDEGLPLIESAARQMPEQPVFRYHLGMNYAALNRKELARQELEKALELSQENNQQSTEYIRTALEAL